MRKRTALFGALAAMALSVLPLTAARAGGGGGCVGIPATYGSQTRIYLKEACFLPTIARVPLGATITWVNADAMEHTVTGAGGAWGSYQALSQNAEISKRFTKSGVYPYFCLFHSGMVG